MLLTLRKYILFVSVYIQAPYVYASRFFNKLGAFVLDGSPIRIGRRQTSISGLPRLGGEEASQNESPQLRMRRNSTLDANSFHSRTVRA